MSDNGYSRNDGDDLNGNNTGESNQNSSESSQPPSSLGDLGWLFGQLNGMQTNQQQASAAAGNLDNDTGNQHMSANHFQALLGGGAPPPPPPANPPPANNFPFPPPPPAAVNDSSSRENDLMEQIQAFWNQAGMAAQPPPPPPPPPVGLPQLPPWQMPTSLPAPMVMPQNAPQAPPMTQQQQLLPMVAMIMAIVQTQQAQQNHVQQQPVAPTFPFQPPPAPPMNTGMLYGQPSPSNLSGDQSNALYLFMTFIMNAIQQQLHSQSAVVSPQQLAAMMQGIFSPSLPPPAPLGGGLPNYAMPAAAAAGYAPSAAAGGGVASAVASPVAAAAAGKGGSGRTTTPKKKRAYNHEGFPSKLHRLILESKDRGKDHIIRFTDDGLQFQILNTSAFETEILPGYFRHGHISSFKRLLRMYGFRRTQGTWEEGTFEHEKFQRHAPELCKEINRAGLKYGSMY